ncbi:Histidine kinase-, DNA gyrase B-, and HSP90-like ATPase [Pedobacter insulae]|uniref:histidine kinase n=2 Tax=Pedobacter insulae TaxID=414048 RepID=A0A1I2VWT5_9SPHI|nr:Histidine kinase-, DNA gyrase B-, and HSP90-like ATPase [Pedobacter insulae]
MGSQSEGINQNNLAAMLTAIGKATGMGFAAIVQLTNNRNILYLVKDDIQLGLLPGDEMVGEAGFASYLATPIVKKDGQVFGSLCVIDSKPVAHNKTAITHMLELFAALIAYHLQEQHELELAARRDKFIAAMGHDIRNPVAAVLNVAELLLRLPGEERVQKMGTIIQRSTNRMKGLIENMLDFARGHLGNGIKLEWSEEPLAESFTKLVEELRASSPSYQIEFAINLETTFSCDGRRMVQLLSNLISNAIRHGIDGEPVQVQVSADAKEFLMRITSKGEKIDVDLLSLDLYVASQIAEAHQGQLEVTSTDEFICFTFKMPI